MKHHTGICTQSALGREVQPVAIRFGRRIDGDNDFAGQSRGAIVPIAAIETGVARHAIRGTRPAGAATTSPATFATVTAITTVCVDGQRSSVGIDEEKLFGVPISKGASLD